MSDFEIDFVSDFEHEHLMVEISYRKQRLCVINKERGNDSMEIEFVSDFRILTDEVVMRFPLSEFEAILKVACEDLKLCD